ncbi:unnamed protein product, partial [Gadus morhua 'NCC']
MATEDKVLLHVQRAHATCPRPAEHPSLSRQGQPVSLCPTPSYTGSRVSLSPSLFIWQTRRHLAAWSRISRCGTAWNTDAWVTARFTDWRPQNAIDTKQDHGVGPTGDYLALIILPRAIGRQKVAVGDAVAPTLPGLRSEVFKPCVEDKDLAFCLNDGECSIIETRAGVHRHC